MTVLPPDPYKILGVSKDVQITEIRAAYRKLALKCHPDKIQDPALKEAKQNEFQQLQQAYELLSNETEREKYDRKVEVYEHVREREKEREREREREKERERERARASARAASSLPKQEPIYYHVKEASPRANTFAKTGVYGSRSWEDTTAGARLSEEPLRHARKTASYEKEKSSKKDEERRKRKEEEEIEREKAKEATRKSKERKEKDRAAREREDREREKEKEKRKEEKRKAAQSEREKERGKERNKNASTEKIRARVIIEEDPDSSDSSDEDVIYEPAPKSERKKSGSGRKPEDVEPTSTERTRKLSGNLETAIRYLARSGGKAQVPGFARSQTYTEGSSRLFNSPMVPVPTPPPAANAPFAPPPPPQVNEPEEMSEDDDVARRSAARPSHRRMSHDTPKASREKSSSHKKPSSSREHQPIIVEAGSPPARNMPSMSRAHTENYAARPMPIPALGRSETWYPSTERERERHERSRSRPTPTFSDADDSEGDRERRRRRSRRTQSPDPISSSHFQYAGTKGMPIRQKQYHDQPPPRSAYKTKTAYVMPNSSARVQRGHPSYAHEYYEEARPQQFSDVKFSAQFDERDIEYSRLPYKASTYRSDVYA